MKTFNNLIKPGIFILSFVVLSFYANAQQDVNAPKIDGNCFFPGAGKINIGAIYMKSEENSNFLNVFVILMKDTLIEMGKGHVTQIPIGYGPVMVDKKNKTMVVKDDDSPLKPYINNACLTGLILYKFGKFLQ